MKKWMCICAAAVLAVSALTGCSTSAGAATTAAQTEAATTDAAKAETEKKETAKTAEASEKAQDTASEEIVTPAMPSRKGLYRNIILLSHFPVRAVRSRQTSPCGTPRTEPR